MKVFESSTKNYAYLIYRVISPIIDPIKMFNGILGYYKYLSNLIEYKIKDKKTSITLKNIYPIFSDNIKFTDFDAHYYFQGLWFMEKILKNKPKKHVDVGSKYELSGFVSLISKSDFVDIRPIKAKVKNLNIVKGDILNLPYEDNSVISLSSLHVIEHIGLGRYGDSIDPNGAIKACKELQRVLKPNGNLYVTVPIGIPRLCFNAHRIFDPKTIVEYFNDLQLIEFSVVLDNGDYLTNTLPFNYNKQSYACGMFHFKKNKK